MKKLRILAIVGFVAVSGVSCTQQQQARFWQAWHKAHPNYCAEDDLLWNGHDHKCETPNEFCKSKFGPDARGKEDKYGDIGCIRIKPGLRVVIPQVH